MWKQHSCTVKTNGNIEVIEKNKCETCSKTFSSVFNKKRHEKVCSTAKTKGEQAKEIKEKISSATNGEPSDGVVAVNTKKRKRSDEEILPKRRKCQCRRCDVIFEGRHELHLHQNTQHGGALQNRPWRQEAHLDEPPWGDPVRDEPLRQIYEGNQNVILADGKIDKGRKVVYNLPTNNLRDGVDEIWWKLDEIFTDQNGAFKINLSLGLILRNMETGEYRYFAPHVNDSLFPSPFLIGSRKYLRIFQNKIRRLDPLEYVNNLRPNSKWRPFMITNVRFDVTPTNFPLGKGVLPDYIKQKRSIVSMEVDSHNKPYKDDHCFFRCLAYHRNRVQEKESLLQMWEEFSGKKNVELADMPDLEKCFRLNLHVYELQPDDTVIPLFISRSPFENDMYLNRYKTHLSYIKDFHSYARKFTCVACQKMFHKAYKWRRHMKQCKGLTKWEYPGTFYAPSETMFDQIKSCGIGVQDAFFLGLSCMTLK